MLVCLLVLNPLRILLNGGVWCGVSHFCNKGLPDWPMAGSTALMMVIMSRILACFNILLRFINILSGKLCNKMVLFPFLTITQRYEFIVLDNKKILEY